MRGFCEQDPALTTTRPAADPVNCLPTNTGEKPTKQKQINMELILQRFYFPGGTNGMLYHNGKLVCYTIELPWLNNEPLHSCIPEGIYRVSMRHSNKFGLHMQLHGVPGRSLILFHPANDAATELKGCIAPVTMLTGEGKGALSRKAFEKLKKLIILNAMQAPVFLTIKTNKQ
ncbi:hypothetical protein BH11BAC4_BH11BAC4_18750 [soil metagenome]